MIQGEFIIVVGEDNIHIGVILLFDDPRVRMERTGKVDVATHSHSMSSPWKHHFY